MFSLAVIISLGSLLILAASEGVQLPLLKSGVDKAITEFGSGANPVFRNHIFYPVTVLVNF